MFNCSAKRQHKLKEETQTLLFQNNYASCYCATVNYGQQHSWLCAFDNMLGIQPDMLSPVDTDVPSASHAKSRKSYCTPETE